MGRVGNIVVGIIVGGLALAGAIWMSLGIAHQWQVYRSMPALSPTPRPLSARQQEEKERQEAKIERERFLQTAMHPSIGMTKQRVGEVCGRQPDRVSSMTATDGTISTWTYRRGDPDRESWQPLNTKCDGNVFGFNAGGVLVVILD
jgi:hypothetical protein